MVIYSNIIAKYNITFHRHTRSIILYTYNIVLLSVRDCQFFFQVLRLICSFFPFVSVVRAFDLSLIALFIHSCCKSSYELFFPWTSSPSIINFSKLSCLIYATNPLGLTSNQQAFSWCLCFLIFYSVTSFSLVLLSRGLFNALLKHHRKFWTYPTCIVLILLISSRGITYILLCVPQFAETCYYDVYNKLICKLISFFDRE